MNPIFINNGAQLFKTCFKEIKDQGCFQKCSAKREKRKTLLEALLNYRIIQIAGEQEEVLSKEEINLRKQIFTNPLVIQMGFGLFKNIQKINKQPQILSKIKRNNLNKRSVKSKILLVNSINPKIYGGGERWLLRVGDSLIKRGYKVFCWALPNHQWQSDAQNLGIISLNKPIPLNFNFYQAPDYISFLKNLNIDAVILNLDRDITATGIYCKLAGIEAIIARKGLPYIDEYPLVRWAYRYVVSAVTSPSKKYLQRNC